MSQKIQHRRGSKKDLPELEVAEIGFTTDTKEVFIGSDEGNQKLAKVEDIPSIDGLETVTGAQAKANEAKQIAKDYTDEQIGQIDFDTSDLATKTELNNKQDKLTISNAINSTSTTQVANSNAVKQAYDRANQAFTQANDGKAAVANAVTAKGVAASPADTYAALAGKIGQISAGIGEIVGGDGYVYFDDTSSTVEGQVFTLVKQVKILFSGTVRVRFNLRTNHTSNITVGRIYVNGVPVGIERTANTSSASSFLFFVEDLIVNKNDTIQLFIKKNQSAGFAYHDELFLGIHMKIAEKS